MDVKLPLMTSLSAFWKMEWKGHNGRYTRPKHKIVRVKFDPAKETPDEYFQGAPTSASQRAHWWTITTHPAGSPLNLDGEKKSQKNSSLIGQAYHLTCCTNIYPKKPTILGHLQQPRKGLISTQEKLIQSNIYPEQYQFPSSTQSLDTNLVFLKKVDLIEKKIHGPNRKVPSYIQQGQQVYPGCQ